MPFHTNRTWGVADIADAEELADRLANYTMTLCTAFRHAGYLYLNDALSEDGAQEYAVVRERDLVQVESITFSWCDAEQALEYVRDISAGEYDRENYGAVNPARLQQPGEHPRCHHCA